MMHDGNYFTDFFEKIMEMSRWSSAYEDHRNKMQQYEEVKEKKKIFWFFYKTVTKKVPVQPEVKDIKADLMYDLIEAYTFLFPITSYKQTARTGQKVEAYIKKAVTYKMLWDFCDFVKLAEYVIFYPNSDKEDLYVEAPDYQFKKYREDEKKVITIKGGPNFDLRIELEEVEDHFSNNTMHVIKLIVDRKEGSKQIIICIDEVSDDNIDTKDTLLLTNLSDFICESCYKVFKDITNSIIEENGVKLE